MLPRTKQIWAPKDVGDLGRMAFYYQRAGEPCQKVKSKFKISHLKGKKPPFCLNFFINYSGGGGRGLMEGDGWGLMSPRPPG